MIDNENEEMEMDLDMDLSAPDDAESSDDDAVKKSRGRPLGLKFFQKTAIVQLNDTMRINIKENEKSMHFERKTKNSESDNYVIDGYFCWFDALLDHVINVCTKERMYTKQVRDYKELRDMFKDIRKDVKVYAKNIEKAIENNEYLKELRET